MAKRREVTTIKDGLSLRWLPVNQAWALMWGDSHILRILNTRAEAEAEMADLRRPAEGYGSHTTAYRGRASDETQG